MTAAQACDLMTIGHSNLPADRFITLVKDSHVSAVIDVRSVPFSRWCPWFSSKPLAKASLLTNPYAMSCTRIFGSDVEGIRLRPHAVLYPADTVLAFRPNPFST